MFCLSDKTLAQVSLAGVLEVIHSGVEIKRSNTSAWLTLPVGAVMPVGTGDSVRTDGIGRVLVSVDDNAEWLTLPNTTWTLRDLSREAAPVQATLLLTEGEVVFRSNAADLVIETAQTTFNTPNSGALHVLATAYAGRTALVVETGTFSSQGVTIAQDKAALANPIITQVNASQRPFSSARVIGEVEGCSSTIMTEGMLQLNARSGPGLSNVIYGVFPDGAPVQVMGIVESGGWYRVQYRSGFGWVERLAVNELQASCARTLPTLPNDSFDIPVRVINPIAREVALLQPFYGLPEEDRIFYRFMSDAE